MDDDGREQEMAVGRLERGKKKLQRVMNKSVRRWMIVIYKQALVLIRQAFKRGGRGKKKVCSSSSAVVAAADDDASSPPPPSPSPSQ